ncbi:MAG TPA: biotin--[acetyl-CoA-carboxylase] ligase, partial [Pseudonocardiaceae bacterium]|nr:biotin--[acetyl-CoA-carboxylase] ligase [Pseudonocardiaceae bacterium]
VLIAEQQTAGQGRQARSWTSPPGSGLYLSVLLRPAGVPGSRLSWLTLLAGVALVRTASWAGATGASLKWPNDLLLGGRKAAGVLAGVGSAGAVVLGMGLNVLPLPVDVPLGAGGLAATSLAESGAVQLDRTAIATRLLTELAALDDAWRAAEGDAVESGLYHEYRTSCGTFDQEVRVELNGSSTLEGTAVRLAQDGTLVLRTAAGEREVSAGDVVHLRAGS